MPFKLETINKTIMVMGAGIAGLTAANEAAAAGYDVILVEKEDTLGGKAAGLEEILSDQGSLDRSWKKILLTL